MLKVDAENPFSLGIRDETISGFAIAMNAQKGEALQPILNQNCTGKALELLQRRYDQTALAYGMERVSPRGLYITSLQP